MGPVGQRAEEGINGDEGEEGVMEGIEETGGEKKAVGHAGVGGHCSAAEKECLDEVEEGRWEALRW